VPRRNAGGLERTIKALTASGRLDHDDDAALIAMARGLAAAVDAEPGNAALWREYRAAVTALVEVGVDDADDDTRDFLLSIRTPGVRAKVEHPEKS